MGNPYIDAMLGHGFRRLDGEDADALHYCPGWSTTWRMGAVRLEIGVYALCISHKDRVEFYDNHRPHFTICALVTDEIGRGRGAASQALVAFVKAARAGGFDRLWLEPCAMERHSPVMESAALTAWYRRYGFEVVEKYGGRIMSMTLSEAEAKANLEEDA